MAMSNAIRRELSKSRELLWLFLYREVCFFCGKRLLCKSDLQRFRTIKFGNAQAQPMEDESRDVTEHHVDGNHENNHPDNLAFCHEKCHKSYHAKIVFSRVSA